MPKIVYYVASSLDGYIMGSEGKMDSFVGEGSGVQQYLSDLKQFDTVIMGRRTYEFGYPYGVVPGQPAYPGMKHFIFSDRLKFANLHPDIEICRLTTENIKKIREQAHTDIYMCGGGEIARWLLENNELDILKIKLNPLILGSGTRIFGKVTKELKTKLLDTKKYDHGLQIMTYEIDDR